MTGERPLRVAARTDRGPDADENEDAYAAIQTTDGGDLLIVCDGMGGMGRGAEASRLAVAFLEDALVGGGPHSVLRAALAAADRHLREKLVDPGPGRPGCTAVAATVNQGRAWVGWAGDARAYHVRAGQVIAYTRDHKLVEELIKGGHLDRAEAQRSRMGHVVTRCLGGRRTDEDPFEPETLEQPWALEAGDALVLCTDGLTDVLHDGQVGDAVAGLTAREASERLVERSLAAGTDDNVTVMVAVWGQATALPARPHTPTAPAQPPERPDAVPSPPRDPLLQVVDGGTGRRTTPTAPLVEAETPDERDPYDASPPPSDRRIGPALLVIGLALAIGAASAIGLALFRNWMGG